MADLTSNCKGIVLVLVLWIITILMVTGLSLSYLAKTELYGTLSYMGDIEGKHLALSALERAKVELIFRFHNRANPDSGAWKTDGTIYDYNIGNGSARVRIINESGKIDLNMAREEVLKKLITNQGVSEEQADIIVDSIMDWKDQDDLRRLHGAESEYYASLPKPYKIKNGNFDSVDELLSVRGVTRELLYGSSTGANGKRGIADLLTVYSKIVGVSINNAPLEVLKAIPGISEEMAEAIVNRRMEKDIRNQQDIQDIIGEASAEVSKYITYHDSMLYTVEAEGFSKREKKAGFGIRTVVMIEQGRKFKTMYYKEPASMRD